MGWPPHDSAHPLSGEHGAVPSLTSCLGHTMARTAEQNCPSPRLPAWLSLAVPGASPRSGERLEVGRPLAREAGQVACPCCPYTDRSCFGELSNRELAGSLCSHMRCWKARAMSPRLLDPAHVGGVGAHCRPPGSRASLCCHPPELAAQCDSTACSSQRPGLPGLRQSYLQYNIHLGRKGQFAKIRSVLLGYDFDFHEKCTQWCKFKLSDSGLDPHVKICTKTLVDPLVSSPCL